METLLWFKVVTLLSLLSGQIGTTSGDISECTTYGSGVFQTLNDDEAFYLNTNCPVTFIKFTYGKVGCTITLTREQSSGLIVRAVIDINNIKTVLENGNIIVDGNSVSLPYDDIYQHVFEYGIFTQMKSRILPDSTSILWYTMNGKIVSFKVYLDKKDMTAVSGLCDGQHPEDIQQEGTCVTKDTISSPPDSQTCDYISEVIGCLESFSSSFHSTLENLCYSNFIGYDSMEVRCSFYFENVHYCTSDKYFRVDDWRTKPNVDCPEPQCPGDLQFQEFGSPFPPTCSSPGCTSSNCTSPDVQNQISTCMCPDGMVLNDREEGNRCVAVQDCPCVYNGKVYKPNSWRNKKCRSCVCENGKWNCENKPCPSTCSIEEEFVKTFDGVQYSLPGICKYRAVGLNWILTVQFSEKPVTIKDVSLQINQSIYEFSENSVKLDGEEVMDLSYTVTATVFWQSSTHVQLQSSSGMKVQVQVSPKIKVYVTLPVEQKGQTKGICGDYDDKTFDEFMSPSGIPESSAESFAQSWSDGNCKPIPHDCPPTDADASCLYLSDTTGIFSRCHSVVSVDQYVTNCKQSLCRCPGDPHDCICVAMESYAKACANQDSLVGNWRQATNCLTTCQNNLQFGYDTQACNRTCRSLSGPDVTCEVDDNPVDGCGCPEGTHLDNKDRCVSQIECPCYYKGTVFSGPDPVQINGQKCTCQNGIPDCSSPPACEAPKLYEDCSKPSASSSLRKCDALIQQNKTDEGCSVGCYCPAGQYEDHRGHCVAPEQCTCVFGGNIYSPGDVVNIKCGNCVCKGGVWDCQHTNCPGKCQVYGNGHYETFDAKWFHFDGHCQYTLAEDYCGKTSGSFSITVESVPCCDAFLTCSRTVMVNLKDEVKLTLQNMAVTETVLRPSVAERLPIYSVHTVGLYFIISVPDMGMTVIWDKNTKVSVLLEETWRGKVCGLCGNFDDNSMNDLETRELSQVTRALEFGNSWKTIAQSCSDAVNETFPCERHSYCAAWAEIRCQILVTDTFKECHQKVDVKPYIEACVKETCSCQFDGKFLGFCTAVAAYAEACSEQGVCVHWRMPDRCPVYCDYYNENDECTWHYQPCGPVQTCGKCSQFSGNLEGCYPKCPEHLPYFDENRRKCSALQNCTCYWNNTIIEPGAEIAANGMTCTCDGGCLQCETTTVSTTTETTTTGTPSTTTETTPVSTTSVTTTTGTPSTTTETTPVSTTTETTTTGTPSTATETTPVSTTTEITTTGTQSTTTETTTVSTTTETTTTGTPSTTTETTPVSTTTESTTTGTPSTATETTPVSTTSVTTTTGTPSTTTETTPLSTTTETTTTGTPSTTSQTTTQSTTSVSTTTRKSSTTIVTPFTGRTTTHTHPTNSQVCSSCPEPVVPTCDKGTLRKSPDKCCPKIDCDCSNAPPCSAPPECRGGKLVTYFDGCCNTYKCVCPTCPETNKPTCPRGLLRQVSDGCCSQWTCDCQCDLFGDPHYITFQGTKYDNYDNCTYILVKEKEPKYNFLVAVDNFFSGNFKGSFVKGVIVNYKTSSVKLYIVTDNSIKCTLNGVEIMPPFQDQGFRFLTTQKKVTMFMDEIRSSVVIDTNNDLTVTLAMEYFKNNTEGQCGVCAGASCVRPDGSVENEHCCPQTSVSWVYNDAQKPYCTPREVPCAPPTPTPTSTPPPCKDNNSICKIIDTRVFDECKKLVNLTSIKESCGKDYCLLKNITKQEGLCSSLNKAAEECKRAGFCVDWRHLTNGTCNYECGSGMVFQECRNKTDSYCVGGVIQSGSPLTPVQAGCFCPDNTVRSEKYKDTCVSSCQFCHGPTGEPKQPGDVWEANCQRCVCSNITMTTECEPLPPPPKPTCKDNEVAVTVSDEGCCNKTFCVEKTCGFKGSQYKVGEKWTDPSDRCVSYECQKDGTKSERRWCPQEQTNCSEEFRVWDDQHCCYTCKETCQVTMTQVTLTDGQCSTTVQIPTCQGQCEQSSQWTFAGDAFKMDKTCRCCQELSSEVRSVNLQCSGNTQSQYQYKHITACACELCMENVPV